MKANARRTVITVIGNVGSGKTTAIPFIGKALNASVIHADNLFQTENPFKDEFLADMKRWAFQNEVWLTVERTKLFKKHLVSNPSKIIVVDSGLLMSWVYAYSHVLTGRMTKEEWKLYQRIYQRFSKEIHYDFYVVHLRYSFPTLLKRIKKRARDYEIRQYRKNYLEELEQGLMILRKSLEKEGIKIIDVKEEEIRDFENNPSDAHKLIKKIKTSVGILDY